MRARLGADHPFAAIFASNRGECLGKLGRFEEARHVLEESLARLQAKFGRTHERTLKAADRLMAVYGAMGLATRAADLRREFPPAAP